MPAHDRQPIVVTHEGGLRFAAQVRSHRLIVDQPASAGGQDAGPMPVELLGVSLATCVALYAQQFCHVRNLPYEGLRVELDQHGARNPNRVREFLLRVQLPHALPAQYVESFERAIRSCPAHHTLAHGAAVSIEVEVPESAGT